MLFECEDGFTEVSSFLAILVFDSIFPSFHSTIPLLRHIHSHLTIQ